MVGGRLWVPSRPITVLSARRTPSTGTASAPLVQATADAAARAAALGFDVLEVQGAHGYLLLRVLLPVTNIP